MNSRILVVCLLFCTILIYCKRDKNPILPTPNSFEYPIKIGHEWHYSRIAFSRDHDGAIHIAALSDTLSSTSVVKISRKATLLDSIQTYQFNETLTAQGTVLTNETYYANEPNGLYMYGYKGPGFCIPKTGAADKIHFKGYAFDAISEMTDFFTRPISLQKSAIDSLIIENPPVRTLAYPLQLGVQWTTRTENHPWRLDKKIIAQEAVTVPAGTFTSYKIRYLYDLDGEAVWDEDLTVYDYVSEVGLVKRTVELLNSQMMNENGEIIDNVDIFEEITLTQVRLE